MTPPPTVAGATPGTELPHPRPEGLRAIAHRLEMLERDEHARGYRVVVDLLETHLWRSNPDEPHPCTSGCVAGLYRLALTRAGEWPTPERWSAPSPERPRLYLASALAFPEGARALHAAIGYRAGQNLAEWAQAHPALWGNPHGAHLFGDANAYGAPSGARQVPVARICAQLRAVAARLETVRTTEDPGHDPD